MPSSLDESARRWYRLAQIILVAGLALRIYFYAIDPSIWFDEAAVMLNVLDKSYAELLGPLDHAANGPPAFLWLLKLLVTNFGDHPMVWRLPALIGSCLGLILFLPVARRVLTPAAVPWAVALLAFSDRFLWHTAEVRPYTIDVQVLIGAMCITFATENWRLTRRLLLWSAFVPIALVSSYPSAFVACGVGLILLTEVIRERRIAPWLLLALFAAMAGLTLLWLVRGPVAAQHAGMVAEKFDWTGQMPDWNRPADLIRFPFTALFEVLRYNFRPTGGLLIGFALIGVVELARRGQRITLILTVTPFVAAVVAAYLHRYPCGGSRAMIFTVPTTALCVAAGLTSVLGWLAARVGPVRSWSFAAGSAAVVGMLAIVCVPEGLGLGRAIKPWPRPDCRAAAEFVAARAPDVPVVIAKLSWDHIYFFRRLDPSLRRGPDAVATGTDTRLWLLISVKNPDDNPLDPRRLAAHSWRLAERHEFGQLTAVLLESTRS